MRQQIDILDERDPMKGPVFGSLLLHVSVISGLVAYGIWINQPRDTFGDANPGGGPSFSVTPVDKLNVPVREGLKNPVATDTTSVVPAAPAPEKVEKKEPLPDKDEVLIPDKKAPKRVAEQPKNQQKYQAEAKPNQVYSRTPQAAVSPMFGGQTGGGVGLSPNTVLGTRFGWYAELIRQRVAEKWRTGDLNPSLQVAPAAIVSFDILRNGSVQNVQVVQSSGNAAIDNSAMRAVYDSNPMQPLPGGFDRDVATVQFTFNLKQ